MTTREPLARTWTSNQAHPIERDGMTERVEVEGSGWDVVCLIGMLAVLLLLALTTPQPAL